MMHMTLSAVHNETVTRQFYLTQRYVFSSHFIHLHANVKHVQLAT